MDTEDDSTGWLTDDRYKFPEKLRKEGFQVTYSTQVSMAVEAFKLVGFANGGAAVALLAFVGAVAKAGHTPNVTVPLLLFAFGLVFCMGAFFSAYWAQRCILRYATMAQPAWRSRHVKWYSCAIACTVVSVLCFLIGIGWAASTLSSFGN